MKITLKELRQLIRETIHEQLNENNQQNLIDGLKALADAVPRGQLPNLSNEQKDALTSFLGVRNLNNLSWQSKQASPPAISKSKEQTQATTGAQAGAVAGTPVAGTQPTQAGTTAVQQTKSS